MFEARHQPLLSKQGYYRRISRHLGIALAILFAALGLGICGYHQLEGLPWLDALLNASMILSGMGPVAQLQTTGGKLFASFYALFSGLTFITVTGVVLAPVFHRFLHKFHLDREPAAPRK